MTATDRDDVVLVLNSGSSSVKFALLAPERGERLLDGLADKVGQPGTVLRIRRENRDPEQEHLGDGSFPAVMSRILAQLDAEGDLAGAGHRIVHGGEKFTGSALVDDDVIAAIRSFIPLAPLHNPAGLAGIQAVHAARPGLPQVAVFDTAFHQTMPPAAYRYAVPGEWYTRFGSGDTASTAPATGMSRSRPPACSAAPRTTSAWSPPTWATAAARWRCATASRWTRPWG